MLLDHEARLREAIEAWDRAYSGKWKSVHAVELRDAAEVLLNAQVALDEAAARIEREGGVG